MDIYRILAERREELGISKNQVAKMLQMPAHDIRRAERGNPRAHTFEKVKDWCDALGLEIVVRVKGNGLD